MDTTDIYLVMLYCAHHGAGHADYTFTEYPELENALLEKLAEEGYNVGKINVDDEGELAERYHVMNIPTLIIFKNGEEKERMVGVQSKDLLKHAGRHDRQGKKQQRFQDRAMKQIDLRTPPGLCL